MASMQFFQLLQAEFPALVVFALLLTFVTFIATTYFPRLNRKSRGIHIPYVGHRRGPWLDIKTKSRWITASEELLKEGWDQYGGSPFRVLTTIGELIILRPELITEVSNSSLFSSYNSKLKSFAAEYPGAEPMAFSQGEMQVLIETLIHSITQSLGTAIPAIAEEMAALQDDLLPGSSDDFTGVRFKDLATNIAARLSARVFLGERVARDREWLRLSLAYVSACMMAVAKLAVLHPRLRRPASLFMPEFWRMPKLLRGLRKRVAAEVRARKRTVGGSRPLREKLSSPLAPRQPQASPLDVLQWMVDKADAGVPFDPVLGQIYLSFVSTHTTSLTMVAAMYELLANPEYIQPLRQEVSDVLAEEKGWTKRALQKMVLMDSVLKESQRLRMLGPVSGLRYARQTVTLSDGTEVPEGAVVAFPTWPMRSTMFYRDPDRFDGYRFMRMRHEPGNAAAHYYVSTSVAHVGFGHGKNSCPGRFLANSVLKIALAFLITNYDWKADGKGLTSSITSCAYVPDPTRIISFRRRVSEIELFH
ncbi:cytochrome P450 [Macrophomina phaseolina]|uniref:Cytochrome P450 n=1 Tax=Macrophomina phaseolina TaxID=35725 RepID=A0ABQ8GFY3_9PEZI|nr:cytochrome P450 [Macrophomina phaseolina]